MVRFYHVKRCALAFAWLFIALSTAHAQPISPAGCVAATALQAWLPFDETSGNQAHDASGNSLAGVVTGGAWQQTPTARPRSLLLAGTDHLYLPAAGQPTAFTVAFWVRPTQLGNWNCFVGARLATYGGDPWGGFAFHTTTNGAVAVGINYWSPNGRIGTGPGVMHANQWQHVVFTFDNGIGTFYHEGIVVATLANMPTPQAWQGLMVGSEIAGANTPFDANISDLRLYFRALSASEVGKLAHCPASPLAAPTCAAPLIRPSPNATITAGQVTTLQVQPRQAALRFDGIADQVTFPSPSPSVSALGSNVVNTFTVEAWVNPTAPHEIDQQQTNGTGGVSNQRYLIYPTHGGSWGPGHAGMGLSVGTNGVSVYEHARGYMPALLVWQGAITGWTHIAVVYQDHRPTLYVNGRKEAVGEQSPMAYVHPSIGLGGGLYGYFQGQADELRIWNESRTAGQIQALYQQAATMASPALVGRWPLDEGSGSTTADASGQHLTGTFTRGLVLDASQQAVAPPPGPGPQWQVAAPAPLTSGLTYTWSPTASLDRSDGPTVVARPATTTAYTVTTNNGCTTAQATITVTVEPRINLPPSNPSDDLNRNWSIERHFDGNGNVIAESKQFADGLGRPTQAQARNMANGHVFAAQTVYSSGGQPVLQTLAAPINNQDFRYQEHFVTATTTPAGGGAPVSADYGPDNFEGAKVDNPDPLDEPTTPGTLGYYYSPQNQLEPLTPATHNPYSLVESYAGPWGGTKRAAAPGDEFRMGSNREGRSREFPLRTEFDNYINLRPQFVPGSPPGSLQYQGLKTVSIDAEGRESIVVANKDGQTLVTCLSGPQYPAVAVFGFISADPANTYDANAPPFQDVHIPAAGPAEVTFTVGDWVRIKNLQTGDSTDYEITPRGPSPGIRVTLQPGFYRFISLGGTQWFSYQAHYGNFSYMFYDDAGRVVATVAPNGLGGNNVLRNPGFEQDQAGVANPTGWQSTTSPTGASYTESAQGARSGSYYGIHWQPAGYTAYTSQVAANLPNGLYTLKAWVRSTGGQMTTIMVAKHYDGTTNERQVAVPNTAQSEPWRQIELTDIAVTNGQCEVGFFSQTNVSAWLLFDDVVLMRQADATAPAFVTRNSYNTLGRLLSTESTDEGRTEYVYARDGRIRFSQSALQRPAGRYSYSNYDELGRVLESGEYTPGQYAANVFENHLTATPASNSVLQASILENRTRSGGLFPNWCAQRSQTWYDLPFQDAQLNGRTQEFTLGAVAKTSNDQVTTWYSFDELGRVVWVVQNIVGVGVKTLDYTYDFNGNVLEVAYQTGQPDAFRHYYEYDASQRLYQVYTSPDGVARTLQAKYFYYLHGPLKRVELANRLQGLDYTYTLQGWLKSINHVNERLDPGADSPAANGIPKDLFALTLDYFSGDYRSRSLNVMTPTGLTSTTNPFRYDGTIRASAWRTAASPDHHQMVYAYDEKSQLTESRYGKLGISGDYYHFDAAPTKAFGEGGLRYDQNGNIQSLRRTDQAGAVTDNFTYQYAANTNKLTEVHSGGASGPTVLDYDYDALGQMTRQRDEQGQRYLTYNVSGKTTGVYFDAAHQQPVVEFAYDDRGFRVSKKSYGTSTGTGTNTGPAAGQVRTTYYVRDIAGNVLSVYEQGPQTGNAVQRSEVPLYGSGRLGTLTRLDDGREDYRYELTDNLGDARVVFHQPSSETNTETMELSGVSNQAAFQNNHLYRAAFSGAPSGSYVAQLSDNQAPGTELKRTLTVEKGDTITFSAQGLLLAPVAAFTGGRVQPFWLLGAAAPSVEVPMRGPDGQPTSTHPAPGPWLGRIAAGLRFTLGSRPKAPISTPLRTLTAQQGWLRYRVLDAQGTEVSTHTAYLAGTGTWEPLQLGLRVAQGGTVEVLAGSTGQGSSVYFDDLTVEQTGGMIVQEQHQYAYGSPLVGLNYAVGNQQYRHGYQGKFAEKDEETGWESFEARMFNSRIGRWMAPDPVASNGSPYVGMGNNPTLFADPDGKDIFIITEGLTRHQALKLQRGYKILYATAKGRIWLGQFENNAQKDLYITYSKLEYSTFGGQTYSLRESQFTPGKELNLAPIARQGNLSGAQNFNGIQTRTGVPQVTLVNINTTWDTESNSVVADILGHEVKAHALNPSASDNEAHDTYGSKSINTRGPFLATPGSQADELHKQIKDLGTISRFLSRASSAARKSYKLIDGASKAARAIRTPRYSF